MKLADEACGSSAWLHAEAICLTASVDSCNFRLPIQAGNAIFFDSYVTFTSQKTMEIEVVVHCAAINYESKYPCIPVLMELFDVPLFVLVF